MTVVVDTTVYNKSVKSEIYEVIYFNLFYLWATYGQFQWLILRSLQLQNC